MAEFNYPNGDLLVSASWLAQHLHDPNMKIIDARSAQDYAAGHIPGAVLLPNGAFRSTRGVPDACTPEEFAVTAGALGVRATDTVVCYDGTGGARTWWVFARFGHQNARFLNGGFRQWTAGGHPTSTAAVQPHPTTYQLGAVQDHLACSLARLKPTCAIMMSSSGMCAPLANILGPIRAVIRQRGPDTFRVR